MEELEDRRMLALLVVNNFLDVDAAGNAETGSLRQAIQIANTNGEADQIIFADYLFSDAFPAQAGIFLNGGALNITTDDGLQIIGPGPGLLQISAGVNNRIFVINDGDDDARSPVTISGVTLSGGSPLENNLDGLGGAIHNSENLTLSEVRIQNNFAPGGGGAIFNDIGTITVDRSLIINNNSGMGGGGIQNGSHEQDENLPQLTIRNSTITGNNAFGAPDDDRPTGYGGGVLNMAGYVNIEQSTVYRNNASIYGGGVGHWGFDPETDDESGEPTVFNGFARTFIRSSIITGNTAGGVDSDVAGVGMTEGDDETPPGPLIPQIQSNGYNLFGALVNVEPLDEDIIPPGMGPEDMVDVDPTNLFISDPFSGIALLEDYGGLLPVFMPDINKVDPVEGVNLAIDRGDPFLVNGQFDQRGFQFVRTFGVYDPADDRMDIGAAEAQIGNFVVNSLRDEFDGRYDYYLNSLGLLRPGTSLRDAIDLAERNDRTGLDGVSTITFSDTDLLNTDLNPDPTPGTAAPTILLSLGQIVVTIPVNIQGPTFLLEVDATGNDPTPQLNNGDGSRVFSILNEVEISNLTLLGGDVQSRGGAILVNGDVTLRNVTLANNYTTGNGGAIHVQSGSLWLEDSTIHSNSASEDGGGVFVSSGEVTISNSTISGNVSGNRGGGIANSNGLVRIQYSTITLNTSATTQGSGVASFRDAGAVTEIRSSIIAGNTINDVHHVLSGSNNIVSLGYNVVGDGNAVTEGVFAGPGDQINVLDPMLAPLLRLGGLTPVHRLLPGSPAIDAGDPDPDGLGNVPEFDQRGFPFRRTDDGNGDGTARIDIGAYEVFTDILLVGDGSPAEGSFASFAAALEAANNNPVTESIVFLDTWTGAGATGSLPVTNSVSIIGLGSTVTAFFGSEFIIDDGDESVHLDVSISGIFFSGNARIISRENLTLDDVDFSANAVVAENGGAISQVGGNLSITNSRFIGNSSVGIGTAGGAIHVLDGNLHIADSTLSGNSTGLIGGSGGAIYIRNGELTGNNLYITGNETGPANGDGAGIYARDAIVNLTDAVISGNRSLGSNSEGAGFSARNSDVTLVNPTISLNQTSGSLSHGGGVYVNGGSLTIHDGLFFRNRTNGLNSSGGGLAAINADVEIFGTTFNGNSANGTGTHGGAIYTVGGSLLVDSSAIVNNIAAASGSKGGAIYSENNLAEDKTLVVNSTISGNSAQNQGGGIHNAGGLTEIRHSTITNNTVTFFGNGAGVASLGNAATTRTDVYSSIISGNRVTNDPANNFSDVDRVAAPAGNFQPTFNSLGYNLIGLGLSQSTFNAPGDITGVTDPGLATLSFNGGPTLNHALLEDSPAINAGNPAAVGGVGGVPEFDQRGQARVQMGRIDIGAYESAFEPVPGGNPVPSSVADWEQGFGQPGGYDGHDFLAWQRNMASAAVAAMSSTMEEDSNHDDEVALAVSTTEEIVSTSENTEVPPTVATTEVATVEQPAPAEALVVDQQTVAEPMPEQTLLASESDVVEEIASESEAAGQVFVNLSSGVPSLLSSIASTDFAGQAALMGPLPLSGAVDFDALSDDEMSVPVSEDLVGDDDWALLFTESDDDGDEFAVEDSAFELIGSGAI